MVQQLNFPTLQARLKNTDSHTQIFDPIRKKFIVLTPEEWVRQHTLAFLINQYNVPISLINVEKRLTLGDMTKRYDIVAYNRDGSIWCLVECKAPSVKITQDTFDQIARYNRALQSDFLMVTNGLQHYYCIMNYQEERYSFLKELPIFQL